MGTTPLTAKQERFVQEYLIDLDGAQAYIRAGYKVKSNDVARASASRLLSNVSVSQAIKEAKAERAKRTEITQDMIIEQLVKIAFGDPTKYMKFGRREEQVIGAMGPVHETKKTFDVISGTFKTEKKPVMKTVNYVDFKDSDQVDGTLISEVKAGRDQQIKLKDSMKAMELLGRHLGMFKDNMNFVGMTPVRIIDDIDDS